jgi:hypothetical protein
MITTDRGVAIIEETDLHTQSIVEDAVREGLELPFTVEHVLQGESLDSITVVKNEEEGSPRLRYIRSDEPWSASLDPSNGDEVFVTLTDSEKTVRKESYRLYLVA